MNEEKKYDDTNWKEEILSSIEFNQSKFASKLLKDGGPRVICKVSILGISTPDGRS